MKIGVRGASGHLGRAVVSELTRTPETVSGPAQGRFGDYNRPESLAEAYTGLDRFVTGDVERLGRRPPKPLRDSACWGAEISFGLKTCTRTDLLPGRGWQAGSTVRRHQGYAE